MDVALSAPCTSCNSWLPDDPTTNTTVAAVGLGFGCSLLSHTYLRWDNFTPRQLRDRIILSIASISVGVLGALGNIQNSSD